VVFYQFSDAGMHDAAAAYDTAAAAAATTHLLRAGVVFYQFSRIRLQSQTGSAFLTDDQTEWVELSRLVFRLKPPEKSPVPVNKFRK
jgi:hypothetical protein